MASNTSTKELINTMEDWFSKLPPLPKNVRDILVKIAPWFALIFGILGVLGSIIALGFLTVLAPVIAMGAGIGQASGGVIGAVLALIASVLMILAFPGLSKRKINGWTLLFYSEIVSTVASVVALSVGGLVGNLIAFYLIFQIRSYYK